MSESEACLDVVASTERAHWYYDVPMALVADIARTLRG